MPAGERAYWRGKETIMSWTMSGRLGEPDICERAWQHPDCAERRRFVAMPCSTCGAAIGERAKYFRLDDGGAQHAACRWELEDQAAATFR
jgi:hypothetical protein